jgi:hypothetical protein
MELEQKEKQDSMSLSEKVELAKIRGKKSVDASPVVSLHPVAKTVEEMDRLLSMYSVILAEPIEERGYLSDFQAIKSWYKFRVVDVLFQAPPRPSFADRRIPKDMLPVNADEFLLPLEGGKALVEGVEVTQRDQSMPRLEKFKRYLLLVSFDPSSRIAEPALGAQSFLSVNADNSLDASSDNHLLKQALKKFHNGSLDQLKRDKQK